MNIRLYDLINALSPYFWRKKSNNEIGGHIVPDSPGVYDIGSATRPLRKIYTAEIIGTSGALDELVSPIEGGTPGYLNTVLQVSAEITKSSSSSSVLIGIGNSIVRNTRQVIAGSGLTGGGDLSNDVTLNIGAGTLISVAENTVGISTGAQYQFIGTGSGTSASWRDVSTLAGLGLTSSNGVVNVGVANTGAAGLSVEDDVVRLTSYSNPGANARILATDESGYTTLVRLTTTDRIRSPLLDTASGNLTIAPASGVISLPSAVAIQTDNYASQLTGWRATYAGEADFRYLFVDEMHAKSFIADLEQALAGGQIITKSVAMVAAAFTVPAAGVSATLRVRDLPSAPNMAVFESGDIVRLRTFNRSGGALTIADAWGTVTAYADGSGGNEGTQTWTFTRSTAPNAGSMAGGTVIQPDAIVLDYGVDGNGYYEINAIDGLRAANSPYARVYMERTSSHWNIIACPVWQSAWSLWLQQRNIWSGVRRRYRRKRHSRRNKWRAPA